MKEGVKMTLREQTQAREALCLSEFACRSADSRGRARQEEECPVRTAFQRDVDRIVYSKAFRRLKDKTQVFLKPEGDHYRTRLTHTLEVTRIARSIARGLSLNEDLTEAVAMGHDLGHTPFGHAGERALNLVMPGGFTHFAQSVRVTDRLEKNGEGLNLTWEVRDGILHHTRGENAATLEGQTVRLADRIAYINHDIEDAIRGNVLTPNDLPADAVAVLGSNLGQRVDTLVQDAIRASAGKRVICQSPEVAKATEELHSFMFAEVYTNPKVKGEEGKAVRMLTDLFRYFQRSPDQLPRDFQEILEREGVERAVCDYIAGMTDPYAIETYTRLFVPAGWAVK